MADKKVSELVSATGVDASDLLLVASGGVSKKLTVGMLASNLPNVGNKGITKNVPVSTLVTDVPLTSTVVKLSLTSHTLAAGNEGQEITLIGSGNNVVSLTGAGVSTITMPADGSTCTLVFSSAKWYVKSYFLTSFT